MEKEKVNGMHFEIFESDEELLRDHKEIIKKVLGIDIKIYPGNRQESSIKLYELLESLSNNVIPRRFIGKVKKREVPWILIMLAKSFRKRRFTSTEASHVLHKARHHTLELLIKLEKMGYLKSKKIKTKSEIRTIGTSVRRIFKISKKRRKTGETSLFFHSLSYFQFLNYNLLHIS